MRIVWKDTIAERKNFKYRGHWIEGYGAGWIIDIDGDDNIYKTNRCARNAIDQALGLEGLKNKKIPKRLAYGIEIIGKKSENRQKRA